jgi:hypothetical protein
LFENKCSCYLFIGVGDIMPTITLSSAGHHLFVWPVAVEIVLAKIDSNCNTVLFTNVHMKSIQKHIWIDSLLALIGP